MTKRVVILEYQIDDIFPTDVAARNATIVALRAGASSLEGIGSQVLKGMAKLDGRDVMRLTRKKELSANDRC